MKQVYDSQGVDLVFLFPFCPACHRSTAVIARALEARGLPTLSINVLWEAGEEMKPPRKCFLDFPHGCPAGKPHEAAQQRAILRTALELAPSFQSSQWEMKTLPFQWSQDGSRDWKREVDALYRDGGMSVVLRHQDVHEAKGESLVGREKEFAIQCNC